MYRDCEGQHVCCYAYSDPCINGHCFPKPTVVARLLGFELPADCEAALVES